MYTSGTTGHPKGAMLTHDNLYWQAFNYMVAARFVDEDAITMISVPIFHIAAIGGIVPTLTLGATCLIMPSGAFDAGHLIDVVEEQEVTDMFLVPTQWQAVCALPGLLERRFKLRSIGWGASPTTEGILRDMARCFPGTTIVALFGQTEMAPVTCALRGEDSLRKMGSVGTPVASVDIRVVDDAMNDVPDGAVGEIVYRGPNLMRGYWNDAAATEDAFRGGWFHSGDLVRKDADGFIYVVDRKKDMIVSGGENVYCAEVEQILADHEMVLEASVVGCPHPKWGETPVAYLVPVDPNRPPESAEVLLWCRERMAVFKCPTRAFVVPELPRNASGKVVKGELRADVERRRAASGD
jgi:acyl-CoA synthetase (AMP-forming)/AMP-acid ligase II